MDFFKKHKKAIIITGSILLFFVILIVFAFTVFSLKNVEVNCLTSKIEISEQMEEKIASEIDLGGTVLFKDKEKMTKEIENKYPYVKVLNIETVFPNKFVVNIAERESLFLFEDILLDSELKVLNKGAENGIKLNILDLDFNTESISGGQFLNFEELKSQTSESVGTQIEEILTKFASICNLNNKSVSDVKSLFSEIKIEYYTDFRDGDLKLNLKLIDKNNFEVNVYNPLEHFENKLYKMFYAYSDVYSSTPEKVETCKLTVYTKLNGEDQAILETAWNVCKNFVFEII